MPKKRATSSSSVLLAEEIHRLVGRTKRRLWLATSHSLEARGESPFRWHTICYLVRNGATSQRDLAYATAQHPAGISRLVEELEKEGLVVRKQDKKDRRKQVVQATKKGEAWWSSLAPVANAAALEAMSALTETQRNELRDLLQELLEEG